jgi:hypothetical protein
MANRRAFISSGASLATLAALPLSVGLALPRELEPDLDGASLVLVDRSLPTGAAFAAAASADGYTVLGFGRDVAGLWMSSIEPRLRAGPVAIAGHTSAATLFCLDLLARDYGARTAQRARVDVDGPVTWVISSRRGRRAPLAPAAVLRSVVHA